MKTTQEYFNMTIDQLLEIRNGYGYTREECKLFDDGLEIIFLDDEKELEQERTDIEKYCDNRGYYIKDIVKTINKRIAVILS